MIRSCRERRESGDLVERLRPRSRPWLACGVAVLLIFAALGCSDDVSRMSPVKVRVDRHDVLVDTPLRVTVTGLEPEQRVTVKAHTTDSSGSQRPRQPRSSPTSMEKLTCAATDLARAPTSAFREWACFGRYLPTAAQAISEFA